MKIRTHDSTIVHRLRTLLLAAGAALGLSMLPASTVWAAKTVMSNGTPISSKGSGGVAAATVPNVAKMPGPPAPFVPVPLPNAGSSGQTSKSSTKIKLNPLSGIGPAIKTKTYHAPASGTPKRLVSRVNRNVVKPKLASGKVKITGKKVVTVLKSNGHNGSSANMPAGMKIAPAQAAVKLQ